MCETRKRNYKFYPLATNSKWHCYKSLLAPKIRNGIDYKFYGHQPLPHNHTKHEHTQQALASNKLSMELRSFWKWWRWWSSYDLIFGKSELG